MILLKSTWGFNLLWRLKQIKQSWFKLSACRHLISIAYHAAIDFFSQFSPVCCTQLHNSFSKVSHFVWRTVNLPVIPVSSEELPLLDRDENLPRSRLSFLSRLCSLGTVSCLKRWAELSCVVTCSTLDSFLLK